MKNRIFYSIHGRHRLYNKSVRFLTLGIIFLYRKKLPIFAGMFKYSAIFRRASILEDLGYSVIQSGPFRAKAHIIQPWETVFALKTTNFVQLELCFRSAVFVGKNFLPCKVSFPRRYPGFR